MHLTEEQLQRWVHREEADPALGKHLGDCPACQSLVDRERQEEERIFQLLRAVDGEPPDLTAGAVVAVAQNRRRPVPYRWAAVLFLAAALTGVAYATPGSPLRSWLEAIFSADRAESGPVLPNSPATPDRETAGIAVDPGERLVIVFEVPPPGARARVTLTDEPQVTVRAATGQARFTSGTDQLLVFLSGNSALVTIGIPRDAPRVEILVGARRLLTKTGLRIIAPDSAGPDSSFVFPLLR